MTIAHAHRFLLLSSMLLPALALARPGGVDWERRVLRCGGTGAPNLREAAGIVSVTRVGARRAAQRDAVRDCMTLLRSISIETGRTVAQALQGDDALASSVEGVVRRFRSAGEYRFFSDGGVELRMDVPLDGAITRLLLSSPQPLARAAGGAASLPAGVTGVLVDASGLPVEHALAPRILDEAGREVYGPSLLDARARPRGTAAYATDLRSASRAYAARLGPAPRVVKALRAAGADVVISGADAEAIRDAACLAEGRVVIVARGTP